MLVFHMPLNAYALYMRHNTK